MALKTNNHVNEWPVTEAETATVQIKQPTTLHTLNKQEAIDTLQEMINYLNDLGPLDEADVRFIIKRRTVRVCTDINHVSYAESIGSVTTKAHFLLSNNKYNKY